MKLSDYVISFLVQQRVGHIFEICGGAITHLLDSLYGRNDIKVIPMHHEQTAAFAAEGYSRTNGNIGVAMATSGPGATNLITGIGSCFFDSIPCLFITGQVNTYEFKFKKPIRQLGFQETDIVSMVKPIVKTSVLIEDPKEIRYQLERLIYIAKSGRPGPVLLDIPMNVQRANINPRKLKTFKKNSFNKSSFKVKNNVLKKVVDLIHNSSRPLVLVGGGLRLSKASEELYTFINKTAIPVVSTLIGKDSFANDNKQFIGMMGTYGLRYANLSIANADLILALGTRLDTRQTGTRPETFARGAKIVHVDVDPAELNSKVKAEILINCDIKFFLKLINKKTKNYNKKKLKPWHETIKKFKTEYPLMQKISKTDIDPNLFLQAASKYIPPDSIVCVDVGQHQMWTAQSLGLKRQQRFLTQGGMGAMGSALAFAIGACFAKNRAVAVVITGDGGFQLNLQELQTVYFYQLPIKIIMLNNSCYGMVRQFQEQYFRSRFQSTVVGYNAPDFQKVVASFKIKPYKLNFRKQITQKLKSLFKDNKPAFLEVKINPGTKVFPKLSVDKPVEDQEPLLSRKELQANMQIKVLKERESEF
ncbi:MAG: thiamine pyrophosphate-binding protein [Candidatus Omnitrophota bacterium]